MGKISDAIYKSIKTKGNLFKSKSIDQNMVFTNVDKISTSFTNHKKNYIGKSISFISSANFGIIKQDGQYCRL